MTIDHGVEGRFRVKLASKFDSSRICAMKMPVEIGLKIRELYGDSLPFAYKNKSHRQIAFELFQQDSPELSEIKSLNVLEHAVAYALKGNSDPNAGPVYEGLLAQDKYKELSEEHKERSRKGLGQKVVRERLGIQAFSSEQYADAARRSAISRGRTPWYEGEKIMANLLAGDKEFRNVFGISNKKIAKALNTYWHGKEVRTPETVNSFFKRQERKQKTKVRNF